jgi:hypothetical protein
MTLIFKKDNSSFKTLSFGAFTDICQYIYKPHANFLINCAATQIVHVQKVACFFLLAVYHYFRNLKKYKWQEF